MSYGSPCGPQGGAGASGHAVVASCYLVCRVCGAGLKTTQDTLTDESKDIVCRESGEVCTGEVKVPVSDPANMPANAVVMANVHRDNAIRRPRVDGEGKGWLPVCWLTGNLRTAHVPTHNRVVTTV